MKTLGLNKLKSKFDIDHFIHGGGPFAAPITLNQKRIYIVPNRQGLIFMLLIFVMFIGSINYANSLGFILTFLVASVIVVSILHTYKNLLGLAFSVAPIAPVFCNQNVVYPVRINNPKSWPRFSLNLLFKGDDPIACEINPASKHNVSISHATTRRGKYHLQRFTIFTEYPFGLIHAWSHLKLDNTYIVYPSIEGTEALPATLSGQNAEKTGLSQDGDNDFSGLREYQKGESLAHIHWKLVAQDRGEFTKQFSQQLQSELGFDWRNLPHLDNEAKLSQLCRWIIDADANGLRYSLWLPTLSIASGSGDSHKKNCLEALALYKD